MNKHFKALVITSVLAVAYIFMGTHHSVNAQSFAQELAARFTSSSVPGQQLQNHSQSTPIPLTIMSKSNNGGESGINGRPYKTHTPEPPKYSKTPKASKTSEHTRPPKHSETPEHTKTKPPKHSRTPTHTHTPDPTETETEEPTVTATPTSTYTPTPTITPPTATPTTTSTPGGRKVAVNQVVTQVQQVVQQPCVSTNIALVSVFNTDKTLADVYRVLVESKTIKNITQDIGGINLHASVNPTGCLDVLQNASVAGGKNDLWVTDINGGKARDITNTPEIDEAGPIWLTDWTIAYWENKTSSNENSELVISDSAYSPRRHLGVKGGRDLVQLNKDWLGYTTADGFLAAVNIHGARYGNIVSKYKAERPAKSIDGLFTSQGDNGSVVTDSGSVQPWGSASEIAQNPNKQTLKITEGRLFLDAKPDTLGDETFKQLAPKQSLLVTTTLPDEITLPLGSLAQDVTWWTLHKLPDYDQTTLLKLNN